MKRTLMTLALVALTLPGCSKFMPSAMHRRAKTSQPAAAAASDVKQPATHVAHQSDKPAAATSSKPATTPATDAHSTTAANHKS